MEDYYFTLKKYNYPYLLNKLITEMLEFNPINFINPVSLLFVCYKHDKNLFWSIYKFLYEIENDLIRK
jgi:hypothetical protein